MASGCAKSIHHHSENPTPEINTVEVSILDGTYEACYLSQSGKYINIELTFVDNINFKTATQQFSSPNCSGTMLSHEDDKGMYLLSGNNMIDYYYSNGSKRYDIYNLDGNNLKTGYRGGSQNGTTPAKRPTSFSSSIVYTKL